MTSKPIARRSARSTIAKPASIAAPERSGVGALIDVPIQQIRPNPWNPNVQPDWIYAKELASIRKYGFIDPLIVREKVDTMTPELDGRPLPQHKIVTDRWYEIIDGEHRWRGATEIGYTTLPCWNLGIVSDEDARELTVVLNETKGKPDEARLRELLQDLIKRRGDEESVRDIMPFSRTRFDEIVGRMTVDWGALEERREALQEQGRWKELVFRVPRDAAQVIEDAVEAVKTREGFEHSWQALEMICADRQA